MPKIDLDSERDCRFIAVEGGVRTGGGYSHIDMLFQRTAATI